MGAPDLPAPGSHPGQTGWWTPLRKKLAASLGMAAFAALILGVLVYRERQTLLGHTWEFRPAPLGLAILVFSLALFLVAWVWASMVNALGKTHLPLRFHLRAYVLSNVAKRIPGTVWYIASRAQMYRQQGVEIKFTSMASAVELALSTLSALLVSLGFAGPIILRYQVSPWVIAALVLPGLVLLHPRTLSKIFSRLKIEAAELHYTEILVWVAAYCLVWVMGGIVLFAIINLVVDLPVRSLPYVIGSWSLVGLLSSMMFFSPSNLGITEIGLSLLLANQMPSSLAVVAAILCRLLLTLFEFAWAGIFLALPNPAAAEK